MTVDDQPIDFSEFANRKPRTPKRKTGGDPERDLSDVAAIREDVAAVIDSKKLDKKTIEEIAELMIRRNANAIVYGGDAMLPLSSKEASDQAKIWASVASMEAARKNGKGSGHSEEDPTIKAVLSDLERFNREKGRPGR